jgi:hypothetical protein
LRVGEIDLFFGGYLEEVPKPHKRKFDDKRRKRRVFIRITIFYGIGIHYYVDIREESNPIWHKDKKCWWEPWDFKDDRLYFTERCLTEKDAMDYIKKMELKYFPSTTHKLIKGDLGQKKWNYKEGD